MEKNFCIKRQFCTNVCAKSRKIEKRMNMTSATVLGLHINPPIIPQPLKGGRMVW